MKILLLSLSILVFESISQGDILKVKVNKLSSTKTQLPYLYYSIPYCRPQQIVDSAENLGEVLRGDRIENSPYEVTKTSSIYHYAIHLLVILPKLSFTVQNASSTNVQYCVSHNTK